MRPVPSTPAVFARGRRLAIAASVLSFALVASAADPEHRADASHKVRKLPPAPPGVTDLSFAEFFEPIGDRGLSFAPKVRRLQGRIVRILGHMVRQEAPVPGTLLLTQFPVELHESEYGFAEDLPAAVLHVLVPDQPKLVPYTPGPLLLTGVLDVGPREEPDGRISLLRLRLLPRPVTPQEE
jgi:hypothetical protein